MKKSTDMSQERTRLEQPAQNRSLQRGVEILRAFRPGTDLLGNGELAERTGLSQPDAEKRVVDVYAKAQAKVRDAETAARDAADKARKASAYSALWLFVSLLVGAFVASLAATFGGRQRDA